MVNAAIKALVQEEDALSAMLEEMPELELKRVERLLQIKQARLTFALDHHKNTRGDRMNFRNYPHIRELYETDAKTLVLQGSVQSFKSEWAIIDHFASAYCGMSVFYVLPKYELRTTYVQNRVNRCVENVPEYKKIIGTGFFDSVALKQFGKGTIKYVGSNVLADFTEYPADMVVVEEVDECNQENLEYALDRLRASPYQFKRYLGNPREVGKGINGLFQESDQREWNLPCTSCGKYSEADWFKTVVAEVRDKDGNVVDYTLRDEDWFEGCKRDIYMICPHCGGIIDRASQEGKWIATKESPVAGYHISMICSLINSIAGMWKRFRKGINDPIKLQQFYNSDLGQPYSAAGSKVTDTLLERCVNKDRVFTIQDNCAHIPGDNHPGPCSMGVDVGSSLDVRISYVNGLIREAVYIGKVKHMDDLLDLIIRYNVETCVIDSMPEITFVSEFQELASCEVWAASYRQTEGKDKRRTYDWNNYIINVDRTYALDRGFSAIKSRRNILPRNFNSILNGTYVAEMCDPVRELVKDGKGRSRYEWTDGEDHQRHCDAYDLMAAEVMQEADTEIDINV